MSELFPTKTRLALLRDVADGHVNRAIGGYRNWRTGRKVTVSVYEFRSAGWISLPPRGVDGAVALTDAGRAVLDTHGGQQS